MKLKLLDLFSGIGGFSLGLERSGAFETVAFCEIEPFCQKVLAKHWPKVPIYDDVKALTAERLAADGITVDAICGGFPCQDISVAGKGTGIEGERSGLWSEYARLICELRPEYVIVENVAALLGRGIDRVLGEISECGYDAEWENIPAASVGLEHRRERIWIVAYTQQIKRFRPIFAGIDAAQAAWGGPTERSKDRFRFEVGSEVPSVFDRWLDRPAPIGMANGVSDWSYRLGALGNAVVPQIPELIGRAIATREAA